jgi:hypothetical protein
MPTGNGYWFTAADGGLFNYGDAPYQGAATGQIGNVVAMATDGVPTLQAQGNPYLRRHSEQRGGWTVPPNGVPLYVGPKIGKGT